jgi:hypothetical protein
MLLTACSLRAQAATETASPRASQVVRAASVIGATSNTLDGVKKYQAAWVIQENQRSGTSAWRVPPGTSSTAIQGYADHVSTAAGERVGLFVSTTASRFRVKAYRMGYYQGLGGRLVWRSSVIDGKRQPGPSLNRTTNTITAHWSRSTTVDVTTRWPPGDYLLKLVASNGGQSYIPLTVRDDNSHAALVIQNSVATWQAYNDWGGYSLYAGATAPTFSSRSRAVSFDRPYASGRGASQFFWMEQSVVSLAEQLGLDVTYWTDVDLNEHPGLLQNHKALITLGHDEYWSARMRTGALAARAAGVNIAFFGANADYRHVRFASTKLGRDRLEICYKDLSDPMYGVHNARVTTQWRNPPVPRPESVLNGAIYQCNDPGHHVDAPLRVVEAGSWIFNGANVAVGRLLPHVVWLEYDKVDASMPTPRSIQIVAHSPLTCLGRSDHADTTYYTAKSGAGVFDAGTQGWVNALGCAAPVKTDTCSRAVRVVTMNVLKAFALGPAGLRHPSKPNLGRFGITLKRPLGV